jgi:hypothetical protein
LHGPGRRTFSSGERLNIIRHSLSAFHLSANTMRSYTFIEKAKITAGAVTALAIVAWLAVVAFALLLGV